LRGSGREALREGEADRKIEVEREREVEKKRGGRESERK
jgi:hypothetical protein